MKTLAQLFCFVLVLMTVQAAWAQMDFEREPINYNEAGHDPVTALQEQISNGSKTLTFDEKHGYLLAVLETLGIPKASQMLVFSKTSFQLRQISPERPRAIYFNDHTYVGWVQGGDVLEISTVDPQQGAKFYTLAQEPVAQPEFLRDKGQCLTCHASSKTQGVPGHLVRSVFVDPTGQPRYGSGTYRTDQNSPFEKRWGGWYVSGTHGSMQHMGNVLSEDRSQPEEIDRAAGANRTEISELLNVEPYLEPTSDIVALMVLEHQTQMHNFITALNYEARSAVHYDSIMNKALDRGADYQSESTQRRIDSAVEKLLQYMLFSEEFSLTSPVRGVSQFTQEFSALGERDTQGRSLRELDLNTRLFKYPCSYLIYSEAFAALPEVAQRRVAERLKEILTGEDNSQDFAHLTEADRTAILEILRDTKPGFMQ